MSIIPLKPKIIVIMGPTASGKTALAIALAKRFDGEVISADSRQVYRGMNIGTGKVTKREVRGIPHHMIDIVSPKKMFTVAHYQKLGRAAVKKILLKGKVPIIAGGTGLYADALIYRYTLPEVKPNAKLRRTLEKETAAALFKRLRDLDPRRARTIDRNNKRRLIRALEIVITTKKPVPAAADVLNKESDYNTLTIGLQLPAKKLHKNISLRLKKRFRQGMIAEVRSLHEQDGLSWKKLEGFGLEYRFIARYLQGKTAKKEMAAALQKEIEHYAKRQMTWFKKNNGIRWVADPRRAIRFAEKFLKK